jgi:hypothetical protein
MRGDGKAIGQAQAVDLHRPQKCALYRLSAMEKPDGYDLVTSAWASPSNCTAPRRPRQMHNLRMAKLRLFESSALTIG